MTNRCFYSLLFASAILQLTLLQSITKFSLPTQNLMSDLYDYLDCLQVRTLSDCAKECMYITICKSFTYKLSEGRCYLMGNKPTIEPLLLLDRDVYVFERKDWPKAIAGSCSDEPCSELEKCIPGHPPSCIGFCRSPYSVPHGYYHVGCYIEGCVIKHGCRDGFSSSSNDTTSTCQANGTWSALNFTCIGTL